MSRHHFDLKLLGKLSQCCASKSLMKYLKLVLGKKTGIPGVFVAIQTFGDYARWHSHLHALVADGLFLQSGFFRHAEAGYPSVYRNFPSLCPEDAEKGWVPEYPRSK